MSHIQRCVITNVDSYFGFNLAYCFLEGRRQERQTESSEIRLLCHDRRHVEPLERLGGKIIQLDYRREDQVREALRDVQYVLFVPENSDERMKEGENIIRIAKEQKVEYMAMFSILGVDQAQQHRELRHMGEYHRLEQRVREEFGSEKHCVVRGPIVSQFFYYMVPMADSENVIRFPVNKDQRWGVVNVSEAVEAIYRLSRENRADRFIGPIQKNKQLFQFTPRRNLNGSEMARAMGKSLQGKREIRYDEWKAEDMSRYLQRVREDRRFRERPHEEKNKIGERRDRPHHFPLGDHLNNQLIELMLEFWQLANRGQLDIVKDDLKQALERDPQDLNEYFENNRDNFRRLQ
ncbi:hypothetical protein EC973_000666 [Apophysomyces ossiformis]|uniref:NAD(P)-binding domain-containing protein n=1 Tax=Apophysomyces ossiformis TaxID=679940 RepID=A0A8H7C0C2_9FUNG|nr:hypothetical protein EC973_000666 [Apophysomyces ossiformis]